MYLVPFELRQANLVLAYKMAAIVLWAEFSLHCMSILSAATFTPRRALYRCQGGPAFVFCISMRLSWSLSLLLSWGYDIVAVTESHLDDTILDTEISPPNHAVYRIDRNRNGRGVRFTVRDLWMLSSKPDSASGLYWSSLILRTSLKIFANKWSRTSAGIGPKRLHRPTSPLL